MMMMMMMMEWGKIKSNFLTSRYTQNAILYPFLPPLFAIIHRISLYIRKHDKGKNNWRYIFSFLHFFLCATFIIKFVHVEETAVYRERARDEGKLSFERKSKKMCICIGRKLYHLDWRVEQNECGKSDSAVCKQSCNFINVDNKINLKKNCVPSPSPIPAHKFHLDFITFFCSLRSILFVYYNDFIYSIPTVKENKKRIMYFHRTTWDYFYIYSHAVYIKSVFRKFPLT